MVEEERAKATEAAAKMLIQIQTGDIEVAKLQLAARWVEMAVPNAGLEEWLKTFGMAYRSIDETLRL